MTPPPTPLPLAERFFTSLQCPPYRNPAHTRDATEGPAAPSPGLTQRVGAQPVPDAV